MEHVTYIGHSEFGNLLTVTGNLVTLKEIRTTHNGQKEFMLTLCINGKSVDIQTSSHFAIVTGDHPVARATEWKAFNAGAIEGHISKAKNEGAKLLVRQHRFEFTDNRVDAEKPPTIPMSKRRIGSLIAERLASQQP